MAEGFAGASGREDEETGDYPTTSGDISSSDLDSSQGSDLDSGVTTLLSRLKRPTASDLARKRKVQTNPPIGKKTSKGSTAYDPKSVSPAERVKAYPKERLCVSNNKLFCTACHEQISLKKSTIELHIKSAKHDKGKERLIQKEKRQLDIITSLKAYDKEVHPSGETLPDSTRVHRVNVVTALLKAGVPLSKLDILQDVLEENAYSLSDSSHLRRLIPFILQSELTKIKSEIVGKNVSIIFDGTTHICEAFVIVLRYMDCDWVIQQRVCRLMLPAKSITGKECARQLVTAVSTELSISPELLVAAMRDRARVNDVAMRTISVIYSNMMDVKCFSHTLDRVGEKMTTPILDDFMKGWISLFAHSPKARLAWKTQTGLSVPSYSPTRWWNQFEVIEQVHNAFGDVSQFLDNPDLPVATTSKLLRIVNDQPACRKLKLEMAITVDSMKPFVKATYLMEGDGPLAVVAYQHLSLLSNHIATQHYPNVSALAQQLASGNQSHEQQAISYAKACCNTAYSYFKEKMDNDLQPLVQAFKAARYLSPSKVNELKPTATDIGSFAAFPFLNTELLDGLKQELPEYLAAAEDVSDQVDILEWWRAQERHNAMPHWTHTCKLILLVQPSSAAAERVFSLLNNSFNSQQESSLEDYLQLSIMLQYNYRKVSSSQIFE